MRRIGGLILAGILSAQVLLTGASPSDALSAYYTFPTISGEESRETTYLYDGVTRTDVVLSSSSKYKRQAFTVVEFDPEQDDLYFEVRGGDAQYLTTKNRTSDTMARFNAEGEGKTALVATNAGLWMSNNYQVRALGNEASYVYPEYPANVKKSYNIPWGYNMYGGEIVCTNNIEEETPFPNFFRAFGITSDGEAIMGQIVSDITVTNQSTGKSVKSEGINRLPVEDALITYTDRGMASNYCLDDAYEVVIDCDYDYTFTPGCTVTGTVTAISKPGTTRSSMKSNRIILTARGDRLEDLTGYEVGHEVSVNVEISDALHPENTDKWYTVPNVVNGHQWVIWDGVPQEIETTTYYPVTIIGIKEDGNVVMITSYGRQSSTGYSYGLQIGQVDELCQEMGVVSAFMMDGGGSATMWCAEEQGGYELTGRPCDKDSAGNFGVERKVLSSLILAVGPSKSGIDSTDVTFDHSVGTLMRDPDGVEYTYGDGIISVTAAKQINPGFKLDLFGEDADKYKYMVVEAKPTDTGGGDFTLGVYPSGGSTVEPAVTAGVKLKFRADGTWQRQIADLSSVPGWSGRMNYVRMDLFDDSGIGVIGEGIRMTRVRFFETLEAAEAFAAGGDGIAGDANGDGGLSLADVSLILQHIAGWDVELTGDGDFSGNGLVNLVDASLILRWIAG